MPNGVVTLYVNSFQAHYSTRKNYLPCFWRTHLEYKRSEQEINIDENFFRCFFAPQDPAEKMFIISTRYVRTSILTSILPSIRTQVTVRTGTGGSLNSLDLFHIFLKHLNLSLYAGKETEQYVCACENSYLFDTTIRTNRVKTHFNPVKAFTCNMWKSIGLPWKEESHQFFFEFSQKCVCCSFYWLCEKSKFMHIQWADCLFKSINSPQRKHINVKRLGYKRFDIFYNE